MIPFATTQHLVLRAFRDSDKGSFLSLFNDERVTQGITTRSTAPYSEATWLKLKASFEQTLVVVVVEIKKEFLFMRGHDPEEMEDELESEISRREKRKFVGFTSLGQEEPKNREVSMGIALAFAWWGKGLGAELLQWLLQHTFEKLGMHRMSLSVHGDNDRAIELYKYLGFVEEGRTREVLARPDGRVDVVRMGMLGREWHARELKQGLISAFDDVVVSCVCEFWERDNVMWHL